MIPYNTCYDIAEITLIQLSRAQRAEIDRVQWRPRKK